MNTPENPVPAVTAEVAEPRTAPHRAIAPLWHTALLIVVLIAISAAGAGGQEAVVGHHGRMPLYLTTIGFEWLVVFYVFWGVHKRGVTLRELTGGRWSAPEDALLDFAISIGFLLVFWGAVVIVLSLAMKALGIAPPATPGNLAQNCAEFKRRVGFLAPEGNREIAVWLLASATAGFCEEIIYRGYLQRQFTAWTRFAAVGVFMQAILFGASHGYQGAPRMLLIAVYGAAFGWLAIWRKSLRPGMIAHTMHDGFAGLMIRPLLRFIGCK